MQLKPATSATCTATTNWLGGTALKCPWAHIMIAAVNGSYCPGSGPTEATVRSNGGIPDTSRPFCAQCDGTSRIQ